MFAATLSKDETPFQDPAAMEKLKAAVGNLNQLPMLPVAATKAVTMARAPDCSLPKLAAVIETDPALAASVLKLANSALYRPARPLTSLELAIVRLGLRECCNLILTAGMRGLFLRTQPRLKRTCDTLWHHSFLTACLCRRLNTAFALGFQGEEFSGGLFHDLGRLLFALGLPDRFPTVDPLDFREGPEVLARERNQLGVDHGFAGAWFAAVNQLPPALSDISEFHHCPAKAVKHQALVALVATGDDMANHIQRERTTEGYTLDDNLSWPLVRAPRDEKARDEQAALLPELMMEAVAEAEAVMGFRAG